MNALRTLSHQIKRDGATVYLCGLAGTSETVLFWGVGRGAGLGWWDLMVDEPPPLH